MIGISLLTAGSFAHYTYLALASLFKNTRYPFVLHVVDNASSALDKKCLDMFFNNINYKAISSHYTACEEIRIETEETNTGIIKARNKSFEWLTSNYDIEGIAVIHSDHYFPEYEGDNCWLTELVNAREGNRGIICTRNIREGKTIESLGGTDIIDMIVKDECKGGKWIEPANVHPCLYTKALYSEIGFYDANFPGLQGWEDYDYNNAALMAGFSVGQWQNSCVWHSPNKIRSTVDTMDALNTELRKNCEYFHMKWDRYIQNGTVPELW
jgi:hypothetical protein